jgi:hypothetical protein
MSYLISKILFSAVLCRWEISPLTLSEEYRLRVSENEVMRIFKLKREEVKRT